MNVFTRNTATPLAMLVVAMLAGALFADSASAGDWPVLKTYKGASLRRVKMPMGGIGTGTISLSGRGSLVDWELWNRPAKGHVPSGLKSPHFAIRCETADGVKKARILEGPLFLDEYEGAKHSPFDEAECGHHYVRAMAAWTVLKAWKGQ